MSNYHTQHSPLGAFASFTIGLHDSPGGFGQSLSTPATQNHYVGFRPAGEDAWRLLPFFQPPKSNETAFTGTGAKTLKAPAFRALQGGEFSRVLGWASDTWTAGGMTYALYSPFDRIEEIANLSEEEAKFLYAPVVLATLSYDNRKGAEDVELIFGLNEAAQPWYPVGDYQPDLCGFAVGRAFGYAVRAGEAAYTKQGFSVFNPEFFDPEGLHRITNETALFFRVPKGEQRTIELALGFHQAGTVTTGLEARYYYNRYFASLPEVLRHGLKEHGRYLALAAKRDAELRASGLSEDRQFLIAQACHSYHGSSQLLEKDGKPLWVVNEGEYRMINTFDLTVDHLFYELRWQPWAMRDALNLFADRYSYRDTLHHPDGRRGQPGGLSFTHDMGVTNQFSPAGMSGYECTELTGCFSFMTAEQLTNWILCAVTYAEKTGDFAWLRARRQVLLDCAESLHHRDDPDPAQRDGIMKWDSDKCGAGSEITTYDSLDESLGQARNNIYIAGKCWASWVLLEHAFRKLGLDAAAEDAAATAGLLARTLETKFDPAAGMFPAVFEKGNASRIIPAIEGLAYPLYLGMTGLFQRDGRFGGLMRCLEEHLRNILKPGICIDEKSGGWKLSSTSTNTWMSKIAISQYVARMVFPAALSPEAKAADAVHASWQGTPQCGRWAACDQIESYDGSARGSKYYPRLVSSVLWLEEN